MGKKILLVDDEQVILNLLKVCFENEGYDIHEAINGNQALQKAREVKPDLIILDLMMSDKWGYSVCEELKKDPETKDAVIMFLTARKSPASKKMGEIKGGDEYMVKPFVPAELREKVKRLLGSEQ